MDATKKPGTAAATLAVLLSAMTTAVSAQDFRTLDPDSTVHVAADGILITPSSSIPATGPQAHTNVHIFQPAGMPVTAAVSPTVGPPVPNLFYETPASIACIYHLAPQVPGCNPDVVTATPAGGSRAIAIVDAYNAPNILADLTAFCRQFGLPLPTPANFQVVHAAPDGTQTSTPPAYNSGWEVEQSLDVEWAHAMAPSAKIILVEAVSNSRAHLLAAEALAGRLVAAAGGGQVSNSWGGREFPEEARYESVFATSGVVYFASTGDNPGTEWPSVAANVVAVGGTSTRRNPISGAFIGEAAWGNTGGGPSAFVARPSYQNGLGATIGATRGVPDVAAVANPRTGVWVYDSNDGGWIIVGGTSVAAPLVAAITNGAGQFSLSSNAELTRIYGDPWAWNDVRRGFCGPYAGYTADAGWDFCTGNGSPAGRRERFY